MATSRARLLKPIAHDLSAARGLLELHPVPAWQPHALASNPARTTFVQLPLYGGGVEGERLAGAEHEKDGRGFALLAFEPGEQWEYGIGTDWLGVIVENVSGITLAEYFEKNIFTKDINSCSG